MAQFETYGVYREVPNTTEKTKIKWAREGLNTDRWQMRKSLADRAITDRPDLFQRRIASNADEANILSPSSERLCQKHHAKRDIIFGIYNYEEATSLYRWMRSLREAGAPCDVVVFTHRAHDKLKKVCKRYNCQVLEYFQSITGSKEVDEILSRPHMQDLRKEFKEKLIKNYKFTFMYCYLLEFGKSYHRAAFMDVRDIFFQGDPFLKASCDGLTTFTETSALLVENREYIYKDHYPKHCNTSWEKFKRLPPLNSGGFIAEVESMKQIVQLSDEILIKCGPGFDQGTFTEIVYLNLLPIEVTAYITEYGPVGMICNSLTVGVNALDRVVNDANESYDVVHQFDRFSTLVSIYERSFPLNRTMFNEKAAASRRSV